jgi:RIO kinase 1
MCRRMCRLSVADFAVMVPPIMTSELVPHDDIASFYDEGRITEVLFPVKSGKEATVYCCRADPIRDVPYYALKVYTPQAHRSFRNDSIYHEGRVGRGSRMGRALQNASKKGRAFKSGLWLDHEFTSLKTLFDAGADVPAPVASGEKGLLIEFIGEGEVPAPTLSRVRPPKGTADALFQQALRNITLMLKHHLVHGDLSPYNILYRAEALVIIDFPQAVDPRINTNAQELLRRDVANVCLYFQRFGVVCNEAEIAEDLWRRYQRAEL